MSLRLRALNAVLRAVVRPRLARTSTPAEAARDFALLSRLFLRPRGLRSELRIVSGPAGALRVSRVSVGRVRTDAAILFLHGGRYVAGSAATHSGLLGRLSQASGLQVVAPDYRLAPGAKLPEPLEDARAVWDDLVATGISPDRIVLAGDSAGGGLALALLADLLACGISPAGLFAFSPWTDLTFSGASYTENAEREVLFPADRARDLLEFVLGDVPAMDPRISPLFARFPDPPPVYFQASRTEILRDDTCRMADVLSSGGGDARVDLWDDAPHVWHLFDGWIPEAREAIARAARFAADRVTPPSLRS